MNGHDHDMVATCLGSPGALCTLPMEPSGQGAPDGRATWIWVAVGCGGLALSLLCIAPPVLWLALEDDGAEGGDDVVRPLPAPSPVDPAPVPTQPLPPLPPPGPPTQPTLPPPPSPGTTSPRRVTVIVEEVTGSIGARPGTTCTFDVNRNDRPDRTFWCNVQLSCGGDLLYGGPNAGFFDCTLYEQPERHVVGEDPSTTAADRDAALRLDTLRRTLTVRDDASGRLGAFTLRARVTSVQ